MIVNDDRVVLQCFESFFKEVVGNLLGVSVSESTLFYLKAKLKRDPFEVLWENPKEVYLALEGIFKDGTDVLLRYLAEGFRKKCAVNITAEKF